MKRKQYDILPEDFEGEYYTVWFWRNKKNNPRKKNRLKNERVK